MKIDPNLNKITSILSENIKNEKLDDIEKKDNTFLEKLDVNKTSETDLSEVEKLEERLKKIVKDEIGKEGAVDYEKVTNKILSELILDIFPSISSNNGLKEKIIKDVFQFVNDDPVLKEYFRKYIEKLKI